MPDKLSEVLGDVLDLACSTGSSKSAGGSASGSAASMIGLAAEVVTFPYRWVQRGSRSPRSSVTNTDSTDSTLSTSSTSSQEFNVTKEQHAVQPASNLETGGLPHQSRSYPSSSGGSVGRLFGRNSSVNWHSPLESSSGSSSHRGSSPHIRAFGPDGRYQNQHDPLHAASSYPPSKGSRSPSPGRAASLDARCGSSLSSAGSLMNANTSQSAVSSVATGMGSAGCSPIHVGHGPSKSSGRGLSPLLIPPCRSSSSDGGPAPPASPLGALQPHLYRSRDGPVFLNARRSKKHLGRLHLRLQYDFDRSDLVVHLIEADQLATIEQGGFSNPYVILTLSPAVDAKKRKTNVYRNDSNLLFDQLFKFPVGCDKLQDKTLTVQVFDNDRFSRNDVIGSVVIPVGHLELATSSDGAEVWGEIEAERKPREHTQEVEIFLSYLPSAGRLTVVIAQARNLFRQQEKKPLDCFVKVNLLGGEKRVRRRTNTQKGTTTHVWNESVSFDVPALLLPSSAIEVCVMDSNKDRKGDYPIVGSCIVGPSTGIDGHSTQSREHWLLMTNSPHKSIPMWHTLH